MRAGLGALALLLLQQGGFDRGDEVEARPQLFRYQREIAVPAGAHGQACAVLDAAVFEHTEGRTGALRVYRMTQPDAAFETPFALTESGEAGQETETARAINVGRKSGVVAFDLLMPARTYTAVDLGLAGHDFYATAKVSGSDGHGGASTSLGTFALFDLTGRGLGRSTNLPLQEVTFPQLHVELALTPAPGGSAAALGPEMVSDARVPPSREAQTLYTVIAQTSERRVDSRTPHVDHFELAVGGHVPVERVSFELKPGYDKNFLRNVSFGEKAAQSADARRRESYGDAAPIGAVERVHLPGPGGAEIRDDRLALPVETGANLRHAAVLDVSVDNGDDAPLPFEHVTLQMRERKVCFDAEPGAKYAVRYGSEANVRAPVYDYARLFRTDPNAVRATLGVELPNPDFRVETPKTSYMERHPEVLWVALLAVIAVLGTVAVHSAKRQGVSEREPRKRD